MIDTIYAYTALPQHTRSRTYVCVTYALSNTGPPHSTRRPPALIITIAQFKTKRPSPAVLRHEAPNQLGILLGRLFPNYLLSLGRRARLRHEVIDELDVLPDALTVLTVCGPGPPQRLLPLADPDVVRPLLLFRVRGRQRPRLHHVVEAAPRGLQLRRRLRGGEDFEELRL